MLVGIDGLLLHELGLQVRQAPLPEFLQVSEGPPLVREETLHAGELQLLGAGPLDDGPLAHRLDRWWLVRDDREGLGAGLGPRRAGVSLPVADLLDIGVDVPLEFLRVALQHGDGVAQDGDLGGVAGLEKALLRRVGELVGDVGVGPVHRDGDQAVTHGDRNLLLEGVGHRLGLFLLGQLSPVDDARQLLLDPLPKLPGGGKRLLVPVDQSGLVRQRDQVVPAQDGFLRGAGRRVVVLDAGQPRVRDVRHHLVALGEDAGLHVVGLGQRP